MSHPNNIARSAFMVSLGGGFSLVARLGSQAVIAAVFGAGFAIDAFFTALVIPAYIEAVLLTGLSFVFVPTFVEEEQSGEVRDAWALVGTFFWLTTGILSIIAVAGAFASAQIITLSAPGFSPEKNDLAAQMLRVLFFALPLHGLSILTKGIQNARDRFFGPAAASAVGTLANVSVVLLLYARIGPLALAWGYLAWAAVQSSVTVLPILRHGWERLLPLRDARVLELARLASPFILFGILTRSTGLVERFFASSLPDGQLAYLTYADKVCSIVVTFVGTGIVAAIFPTMARAHANSGIRGLVQNSAYGLRLTLATALPAVAILSAVRLPLIALLFERGAFDRAATIGVGYVLPAIVISGLFFKMLGNILGRTFYVMKDTVTPPLVAFVMSGIYIALAWLFVKHGGYVGLAWAQTATAATSNILLLVLLFRRLELFDTGSLFRYSLKYTGAATAAYFTARMLVAGTSTSPLAVQAIGSLTAGGFVYLLLIRRFDREIASDLMEMSGLTMVFQKLAARRSILPAGATCARETDG